MEKEPVMANIVLTSSSHRSVSARVPENYTQVSGIYSEDNEPRFLSYLDNVCMSSQPTSSPPGEELAAPSADSRSIPILRSILAARIPAAQSPVVWDDGE